MKTLLKIAMLILLPAALVSAQEDTTPTFSHARFVDGDRSIGNLVDFPRIDGDAEVAVICNGIATAKGRLDDAICSAPDDIDQKFTMAVSRRFRSTRLVPATIDGRAEEVKFQFTVVFKKQADTETVDVYLNNGKNVDRLGLDYVGAQLYSTHIWPTRCSGWTRDDLIIEAAVVQADGLPREVNVMSASVGLPPACSAGLTSQLEAARWIPASLEGRYVEAVWINPIVLSSVGFRREQQRKKQ